MTMIKTRTLGANGPEVAPIGFGCFNISGAYGNVDEGDAIGAIHAALDCGVTLFDTADFYGGYTNEALLAKGLGQHIRDVIVSTKGGVGISSEGGLVFDAKPATIKASAEASLKRLGVEAIDLYLLARVDKSTPIEDTVGALADLVASGKIKHIGLCEVSAPTIRRAHAVHPLAAVQNSYSLMNREQEDSVLPTVRELGIALIAYSPLGRGLLSGALEKNQQFEPTDFRNLVPMFQGENLRRNVDRGSALRAIAERLGTQPAPLALAWLLAKDDAIIPIPGTRRAENVRANCQAADLHLDAPTVAELDALFPPAVAAGERYPEFLMAAEDR